MRESILCCIIVLAAVTLYIISKIQNRNLFDKICRYYIYFIIFHASYTLINLKFVTLNIYIDTAAPFGLAYGPFLLIASRILLNKTTKNSIIILHFTPFILFLFTYIALITSLYLRTNYVKGIHIILYASIAASMLIYAFSYILRGPEELKDTAIKKLMKFSAFSLVILAFMFASMISNLISEEDGLNIALPAFIVHCAMLISTSFIFNYALSRIIVKQKAIVPDNTLIEKTVIEPEHIKYFKSAVKIEDFPKYKEKLDKLMDNEKVYLQNELNLDTLAKKLKISRHYLTQLFNTHIGENFNQYINRYRIEHAKQLLRDNVEENLTIEEISFKSGFNSKVSFNRHFKNYTGVTPSEFTAGL